MKNAAIETWTKDRADKLARRLDALRQLNDSLPEGTILRSMNDSVILDLELKLFKARAQLRAAGAARARVA